MPSYFLRSSSLVRRSACSQKSLRLGFPIAPLLLLSLGACSSSSSSYDANEFNNVNNGPPLSYPSTPVGAASEGQVPEQLPTSTKGGDFIETSQEPLSTFAIDVDTGSYSLSRQYLASGILPPSEVVRAEEYLNYFDYGDPAPPAGSPHPFAVQLEGAPSKFGEGLSLLRIALRAKDLSDAERPDVALTFLVDSSGSMAAENKLPLVKASLGILLTTLRPTDTIALVTYAGDSRIVLEPTPVKDAERINRALREIGAGGGTNGSGGITAAYQVAARGLKVGGANRVVLCTDGDFNVGLSGEPLYKLIEAERDKGVTLTTLGFGTGNYRDHTLEQLADRGNGNYAYIDNLSEAQRVLSTKVASTIQLAAKDVKVQVAFDPTWVTRYRLIGYENRRLANSAFRDDKKDAGEMGPGHTVVALYEAELNPMKGMNFAVGEQPVASPLAEVRLRYKPIESANVIEWSAPFLPSSIAPTFEASSAPLRMSAAVVEFAEILSASKHSQGRRLDDVLHVATSASLPKDADRLEFLSLVGKAKAL
ncbi:MAG: von Willebrand factor type A domain-containing protein [Polyangiaceae bacterium]|nr:von Willebrand factor type A domain-containing protein [Polyangiaceae bacterium]